jgi:hypothetical protein
MSGGDASIRSPPIAAYPEFESSAKDLVGGDAPYPWRMFLPWCQDEERDDVA